MAQRYPHHALPANPDGTALLIPRSQQHSATHRTASPPITTAQRHPRNALPTNHNCTAPCTRHAHHQSPRHSASDTTRPPPIPKAQQVDPATKQSRYRPILRAQRIGHIANARERARYDFQNLNEHGPGPRPPSQKQEPFATHSGKLGNKRQPNKIKSGRHVLKDYKT